MGFFGTLNKNAAMLGHLFGLFLTHRTAQKIGATERVTADDLRDLHHLFLIDDDAVSGLQRFGQIGMKVIDLLLALLAQNKVIDHARAKRSGAVQRQHRDDVFEAIGLQFFQQLFHAIALNLKDASGIGVLQNLIGGRVGECQCCQVEFQLRVAGVDVLGSQINDRQIAQAKKVEFDQADRLNIVFVELTDYRIGTRCFV